MQCRKRTAVDGPSGLAVPWECMLVYDAVVLLLTIIKTYSLAATRAKVSLATNGVHIPTIVLRDGKLIYYLSCENIWLIVNIWV